MEPDRHSMDKEATNPTEIPVRWMREDEKGVVRALADRAFPLGNFFSPPPHTLVAERSGRLVGAVVPELFVLPDKQRGGVIVWLMTAPEVRGCGVGGRLVETALGFFKEHGCREVFACVEGFNTSSGRIFAACGFTILSPGEQFRRYGLTGTLALWLKTHRLGDVGNFLWAHPGATELDSSLLQWWVGAFVSALIFLLAMWRGGWIGLLPSTLLGGTVMLVTLYGLRQVAMVLMARFQGVPVRHRMWESGFILSAGVAATLGLFFPVPGSVYPRGSAWRYRDLVPKLGLTAFAGALVVLVFTWAAWALLRFGGPPAEIATWLRAAYAGGLSLTLLDMLVPFFPFVSFNGRRVWDWNRPIWGALAVAALILMFAGWL
ncbi:MAG: GNAT family N-acetyltransferase [Rubrobacter sp.]|nr:GNAT family N-acetyltransferase [Rubrobacter sp.]